MHSDLDRIMRENGIDALWVTGTGDHNPNMVYFTGLHHITNAELIKPLGKPAWLFHNPMEREEAAKTGLMTSHAEFSAYSKYLEQSQGDALQAHVLMNAAMLQKAGVTSGRVAVSGKKDAGLAFSIVTALQKHLPQIEFVGQFQDVVCQTLRRG